MANSKTGMLATYRDAFSGLPRLTWLLCLAAFLNRCGSMVVLFLGLYAKEHFGYSATDSGYVLSLYGGGDVLVREPHARWPRHHTSRRQQRALANDTLASDSPHIDTPRIDTARNDTARNDTARNDTAPNSVSKDLI
ncbi:MAG: hypothetical protein ACI8UD_002343 [Planctomycetota bacterium]|jgi:hypothetical protein